MIKIRSYMMLEKDIQAEQEGEEQIQVGEEQEAESQQEEEEQVQAGEELEAESEQEEAEKRTE
jgi:hypothetical protein